MKPYIGVFPSYDEEKKQIFLNNSYFEEIISAGGIPVAIPLCVDRDIISECLTHIDGIVFSGGTDIDPKYYGKDNVGKSKGIVDFLDECEELYIKLSVEKDIPILGICRGMQALNVFCGGSLYQDISSEYETKTIHSLEKPEVAFHNVNIPDGTLLSDMIGSGQYRINSYHHQAVKNIAPYFSVAAISEDGIIEAIYHNNKRFVLGVQWHPERDHSEVSVNKNILIKFIEKCVELRR